MGRTIYLIRKGEGLRYILFADHAGDLLELQEPVQAGACLGAQPSADSIIIRSLFILD